MIPKNKFVLVSLLILLLSGCASPGGGGNSGNESSTRAASSNRLQTCKRSDQLISSKAQCLQDDAACYQINNGSWCTGPRGATCPTGSTKLQAGHSCPIGGKCFSFSEGLTCEIIMK